MEYNKLNKHLEKIKELLDERNWSLYRLSKESNITYSSLNSLFLKNNQPTISTLEKICQGFHITLSEFFASDTPYRYETPIVTKEEQQILDMFRTLNKKEKEKYIAIMNILKN